MPNIAKFPTDPCKLYANKQSSRGFTLIELLVVMVIIVVVVATATITLGDNQAQRLEHKSQQLAALIDVAKEQAIFNSEELGMVFTKNTFSFYRLTEQNEEETKWEPIEDDRVLSERALPEGLEYELYLEGIQVSYSKKEKITPQVFILSDGSVTPFQVKITDKVDHMHSLKVAENGVIEFNTYN